MVDRSDIMVLGAFISGLRPGRLFKDLIAKPPTSLEDLFTQTYNFIRAEEANKENRLQESPRETRQHPTYKDKHFPRGATRHTESHKDHGHDTNDCIDLRQEIEACIWKGRMAHLAKGVKTDNHNQHTRPLGSKDTQEDWSRKMGNDSKPRNEIQMVQTMNAKAKSSSIAIVRGEQLHSNICNQISQKREHQEETSIAEVVEHIILNDEQPEQTLAIAANLPKVLKSKLQELLQFKKYIFAWTPADMIGIPRELAEHKLNIHPRTFPVCHKKRVIAKERSEAITTEMHTKVTIKYVWPRRMKKKTSFHTEQGTFCYVKMSFGLKNVGATYQRLMDNVFSDQPGRNIEVYVDDMVIKSKNENYLISDIAETFNTLNKANMKLNPKKYTFWVETGQFLGYVITNKGI
uniref:Reverse transcriptase domain-containing protein n=1 Tax=Lactuca sativa TaxID=4236 RepID=A0A9R1X232_LACSA|nr:hypothetical protein LSAT_V11C700375530 [Lactuca sativa]